jgi:hypothetical protein
MAGGRSSPCRSPPNRCKSQIRKRKRQPKKRSGKFAAFYSRRDLARMLDVTVSAIGHMDHENRIPVTSIKVANLRLYRTAAINRWLSKLKKQSERRKK